MTDDYLKEMTDRLRRLETRFTKFMELQGFDTKVRRPHFSDGVLSVPTLGCSVGDLLACIPPTWNPDDEVQVRHNNKFVMSVYLSEPDVG